MSRSKKWRLEWSFFLGGNGRRQYNEVCQGCVHDLCFPMGGARSDTEGKNLIFAHF